MSEPLDNRVLGVMNELILGESLASPSDAKPGKKK
jgi:hypothetical protein